MSRTDKDRPYWVKLNDDGASTDHHHLTLGEPIYRTKYVRGDDGKVVFHEVPRYYSARFIASESSGMFRYLSSEIFPEKIVQEARELCQKGRGYEMVAYGTRTVAQTERVLVAVLKDYCTEGEKFSGGGYGHYSDLPCTPAMAPGQWGYAYSSFSSSGRAKRSYYSAHNGKSRRQSRDYLRKATDGFNTFGESFDGEVGEVQLTSQHRHSMSWDLY